MSILANGTHATVKSAGLNMKDAIFTEPRPIEKFNWLIHLYHVRGEITSCKNLIQTEIAKTEGTNEFAYFMKATITREESKTQEALELFQSCHKLNPSNVDNIKEIGKCLFILRRYRLALEAYLEAESLSSKPDWEIYHNIGECYMLLKEIKYAKEFIQKAVKLGSQEVSYGLLIKILYIENDIRSAVSVCNSAVDSCPDSVDMLIKSGLLYLKIGETQHSFERLSSALALESTNPKALLGIGCITQNHEEYDVALSKYKIAVQSDADSVALWNNIGMCFYSKQKYIAAVTCLKRALWLSPLNWKVLLNLGLVNLSTNQPASSFNFLCAAVNIRSDIGYSFMLLGCSLLELRDKENSLRALTQALTLDEEDPYILANTCLGYMLSNQYVEANAMVDKFKSLNLSPNDDIFAQLKKIDEILQNKTTAVALTNSEVEANNFDDENTAMEEDEV